MTITKRMSKEIAEGLTSMMRAKTIYFIGFDGERESLYNTTEWNKTDEEEVAFVGMLYCGRINGKQYSVEIYEDEVEEAIIYYTK